MLIMIKNFFQREDGVTAIEYALIASLIALVIVTAVGLVGDALVDFFTTLSDELAALVN